MSNYDVIVIGSGPGGYTSAIRNAQLGKKVAIVEKYPTLGGTCLNVGCIPSKALLDSSKHYSTAVKSFDKHGISTTGISLDFPKMVGRKNEVVSQITKGVQFLMEKNKIEVFQGHGSLKDANTVAVKGDKEVEIKGTNIILATGSKPSALPFAPFDKERIISSTEALTLPELPKSMIVIGGGVIGLEMGSVYARLGVEVQVVEFLDKITPGMDEMVSKELMKSLKKQGLKFHLSTKVQSITNTGKAVTVEAENKKGDAVSFEADYCLVACGRAPYSEALGLENVGIELDERKRVPVNANLQTKVPNIYAIGDLIEGPMLAHKAEEEGVFVAEIIDGQKPHVDHHLIPGVVYTWPEAASVGSTEQELKDAGRAYKVGKYSMKGLGRARASEDTDGMVKVLADKETDEVLGVHLVAARAADIISEAAVAMTYRASAEDIGRICHAHPTFAEAFKEAALDATDKRAINA